MAQLKIIKANHNNIAVIPYLKHVRYLELMNNPIKLLTTHLALSKLQHINFDWIPYLMNTMFAGGNAHSVSQTIIYELCDLI